MNAGVYEHRQFGWTIVGSMIAALVLLGFVGRFAGGLLSGQLMPVALLLVIVGGVFSSMTVRVGDGELRWWLGPVRGFGRRIAIADIESIETTKTNLFEGWGIHLTIWHGWVWNVSGFNAVEIRLRNGTRYAVGTPEPQAVIAAVELARGS